MKNRLLAMLLVLAMVASLVPAAVAVESTAVSVDAVQAAVTGAADPITVTMNFVNGTSYGLDKNGNKVCNVPVEVTDRNEDGKITMEEGFLALHESYHTNGVDGYEGSTWISKFWSITTAMVSYAHNHSWVFSPQEEIQDGDTMDLYIYQDQLAWSDLYTYFDSTELEAEAGTAASFKLNGLSLFGSSATAAAVAAPVGATIKVYDENDSELTALTATVGTDGTFSVTFPKAGTYTIEAGGKCSYMAQEGYYANQQYTDAPVVLTRATVTVSEADEKPVPTLKEGVEAIAYGQTVTGRNYDVEALQKNQIFDAPEGETLNYASYWYVRSTDGGETWSETPQNFPPSAFGYTTIQFTENKAGTYMYQFRASTDGGETFSKDTWTLVLTVSDESLWDVTFNVGRDMNYSSNGNQYPVLKLWKTAGITDEGFDYVGWYEKDGDKVYVTVPTDYTIALDEDQWLITDADDTYELNDYEPVSFTDSTFGKTAGDETEVYASGDVVSNYAKYYASIVNGRYSFRAYGWNQDTEAYDINLGGMSITIPTDKNVDGGAGGGTELYLVNLSLYTNSAKSADKTDYFDENSYYTDVVCPIMGCHATSGDPYVSKGYTYYPYMVYAAGNACLYNYYGYPKTDYPYAAGYENWMFARTGNQTPRAGYAAISVRVDLKSASRYEYTVPATAEFGLYYQDNNFNTRKLEPMDGYPQVNGETKTYVYMAHTTADGNYTWRLTDTTGRYATLAGWGYPASDLTNAFQGAQTDKHYHQFDQLGSQTTNRDEADLMVNVDPTGFTTVEQNESVRIRSYRFWQLINSDAGNIMVEPDFHHTILSGKASAFTPVNGGNTSGNWIDVDPDGTVIAAVYYDAVDVDRGSYGSHGGFFPATNPERVGVYIVSDEAAGTATASIPRNGMNVTSSRPEAWDYNFDTWYYSEDDAAPVLNFTTSGASTVEYATVMTDSNMESTLSGWTKLTAENGTYMVDLLTFRENGTKGGTVILRMMDADGNYSYQSVRVAQVKITVNNVTNPGEPVQPGNTVKLTFKGLYRAIHKISGIFNPTNFKLRYTADGKETDGSLAQYQKMDNASISLTIPENVEFPEGEDTVEYVFTNGYTYGSMYSAANPFGFLYTMTDTGVGTNFNAVTVNFAVSKYADAAVTVHKAASYKVSFRVTDADGEISGYGLKLTDANGNVVAPNADGTYSLTIGEYFYDLTEATHVRAASSFRLGAATENENGNVTWTLTMEKAGANAWDGAAATEPKQASDGVYQISNAAELAWFAAQVNSGAAAAASAKLVDDIELASYEWTSIGTSSQKFTGTFDGDGHTVKHLLIHYNGTTTVSPYAGLFGYTSDAVVENLTVEGEITLASTQSVSSAYSGGIVGYAVKGELTNVKNYVNVTVNRTTGNWSYLGGVVGYADGTVLDGAANYGNVSGYNYVGGVAGYMTNSAIMRNSLNAGEVSGNSYVGGIASYLKENAQVLSSVNRGTVTGAGQYVGGIVGYLGAGTYNSQSNCQIRSCYNTGAVEGDTYVGGIVGYQNGDSSTNGDRDYWRAELYNCYSTGEATGKSTVGAVIGKIGGRTTAENIYYVEGKTAIGTTTDLETNLSVMGKSLAEMSTASFLSLINGDNAFVLNANGTPKLSWEENDSEPVTATVLTVESVSEEKNPGEEVTVAVKVSGNTGFTNFELLVDYDHSKLELKSINTSYYYEPLDMDVDYLPGFIAVTEVNKNYQGSDCGFITVASGDKTFTKDATLFTLTFKVKSSAGGSAAIRLINQKFNLVDQDGEDNALNVTLRSGTISTATAVYNVSFLDQDGESLASVNVKDSRTVAAADIPAAPTVEHYNFLGWTDGTTVYTAEQIAARKVTESVTYTAAYEAITYTVTFQDQEGKVLKRLTVVEDATVAAADIPAAPAVTHYAFAGWKNGDTVYTAEQLAAEKVQAAVTYTAAYTFAPESVTLTMSGETAVPSTATSVTYTVSAKDMYKIANATLNIQVDADYLDELEVTAQNDWRIIATTYKDGVLQVAMGHLTGASGDGDLLKLTAKPTGKAGETTVKVLAADLAAYADDEAETTVTALLDSAFVTTSLTYNRFDVNHDGVVDLLDITRAQRWYGTADTTCDVDGSGTVDIVDLILILNNYTK